MPPSNAPLPKILSVRALVLEPIFAYFDNDLSRMGILLHRNGLSAEIFDDLYTPIPLAAYLDIFEQAAELAGDPLLGARLGFGMRPGTLAPIGLRAVQAATIRRGLAALARWSGALQSGTQVSLEDDGAHLVLRYMISAPRPRPCRQDSEFTLAGICTLIRTGFDTRWRPEEVHFAHPEGPGAMTLARMFGAPVLFSQGANAIVMAAAEADRPHRTEDADMIALIERHLGDLIGEAPHAGSVREQVVALIGLHLGVRPVTLETIAAAMRISPRSLQRRLADEGESLSGLLAEVRRARAETLLHEHGMRVEAVASALGYADGTAFWRAWRRWTGESPSRRRTPPKGRE